MTANPQPEGCTCSWVHRTLISDDEDCPIHSCWPLSTINLMHDDINQPAHYTHDVEPINAIEAWGLGFHLGNVVKYIARHQHKGTPLEDLKKARWYLDRVIEMMGPELLIPEDELRKIKIED